MNNEEILLVCDSDNTLFDCDGQLNGSYDRINFITPFPGVKRVLSKPKVIPVLLTKGQPLIQRKKIKVLGLESYFRKVFLPLKGEDKRLIIQCLADEYRSKVRQMFVAGDRLDYEIQYGNEFGLTTIRMAHGKYASIEPSCDLQIPNYTVRTWDEIFEILS